MESFQPCFFAVKVHDYTNGDTDFFMYSTKDDAVNSVMISDFHTDKSESELDEYFNTDKNPFCVEQHDGQLYWQWVSRQYADNKLVTSNGVPSTFQELRTFIECGHEIVVCKQSRAPILYKIIKVQTHFTRKNSNPRFEVLDVVEVPNKSYGIRQVVENTLSNKRSEIYDCFLRKEEALNYLMDNVFKITWSQELMDQYLKDGDDGNFVLEEQIGKLYRHIGERTYQNSNTVLDFDNEPFTSYYQFREFVNSGFEFKLGENTSESYQVVKFLRGKPVDFIYTKSAEKR